MSRPLALQKLNVSLDTHHLLEESNLPPHRFQVPKYVRTHVLAPRCAFGSSRLHVQRSIELQLLVRKALELVLSKKLLSALEIASK